MALDKHGVPERPIIIDPGFFGGQHGDVVGQAGGLQNTIWVTKELKAVAQDFFNSWDLTYAELLTDHSIDSVQLKFKDAETRNNFLKLLKPFVELNKKHISSGIPFPSSGDAKSQTVTMRLDFFRPDVFSELVKDLTKTKEATIPILPEIRALAERYLEAFSIAFVRFELCAADGADQGTVEALERTLADSLKKLVAFLKQLLASLPSNSEHLVIIRGVDEIEVDGEPMEIKGAALRALLALALLRDKLVISVDEFAKCFNGRKPVEARHDFDNGFNALKKHLPKISRERGSEKHRTVSGIKIRTQIDDAAITKRLRSLHKDPSS